ncbi:hypothetical protein KCU67_g14035, partial [Aureobasidium melanogenum]
IEKTLSAWVVKEQKKGSPITDEAIREQAYYFASIPGPENPALNPVNNPGWLEKFKQKHRIDSRGTKDQEIRKDSVADSDNTHNIQSPTSPSDDTLSSSSPETIFPTLDSTIIGDAKPVLLRNNKRRKSPPCIDTAFTDLGSTSTCFTPQLLSPTSPFFLSRESDFFVDGRGFAFSVPGTEFPGFGYVHGRFSSCFFFGPTTTTFALSPYVFSLFCHR